MTRLAEAVLGKKESHPRSIVKAVTWRILGSLDTFLLSFLITGSLHTAGAIASVETVTKIVLYYLHERGWSAIRWGREEKNDPAAEI
jgi:uncharacterized membrane protein